MARILNEFAAAMLIQERRVTSNTSEVECPNCMMEESVIAFCEQCTKNAPTLILRNRLLLHVSVIVFILQADF